MLPAPNSKVVPTMWQKVFDIYSEHAAWYSGDPNQIAKVYSSRVKGLGSKGRMWSQQVLNERRTMIHVPIAGDVSSTSASLMFGEHPRISFESEQAKERWEEISGKTDVQNRLLEAAETASAIGGVYLKVDFIQGFQYPILSVAQADNAIPDFVHGILTGVTFFKEIPNDKQDQKVYRLVERHEVSASGKAQVEYGLFVGTEDYFGQQIPLDSLPDTEGLPELFIYEGIDGLAVRYIPNIKPYRRLRGYNIGRSDYDGLEGLFDALDEVYSSWMRDIRLAKARIIVPEEWLKKDAQGNLAFDTEEEIFTLLDMDPVNKAGQSGMGAQAEQFAIRANEHYQTALELMKQIITLAGYSIQDFGIDIQGSAESGTALNIRRQKSLSTQAKKAGYWKSSLEDIFEMMMIIDNTIIKSGVTPERPNVEMQDGALIDMNQLADTLVKLNQAQATSIETSVSIAHPDWEEVQIQEEVDKIMNERGLGVEESPELELT
jgi:A118 family predicted phage portal protein